MAIFSLQPVSSPQEPKSSDNLSYLNHHVEALDIVASGGLSHYTLSIDATGIVVDKPETKRLSLFLVCQRFNFCTFSLPKVSGSLQMQHRTVRFIDTNNLI